MAPEGFRYLPGYFSREDQIALLKAVRAAAQSAPFYRPAMPRTGTPMRVTMTNFGPLGWVTDQARGYRYQSEHPGTGAPWPHIPELLLHLWARESAYPAQPQACLVNHYTASSRMGLHVDSDEDAKDAPVISVSIGDSALFRIADAPGRSGPTTSMRLHSGDVVILGGAARLCRHGVDRILPGPNDMLRETGFPEGGRINLTLRRVTRPPML